MPWQPLQPMAAPVHVGLGVTYAGVAWPEEWQ